MGVWLNPVGVISAGRILVVNFSGRKVIRPKMRGGSRCRQWPCASRSTISDVSFTDPKPV